MVSRNSKDIQLMLLISFVISNFLGCSDKYSSNADKISLGQSKAKIREEIGAPDNIEYESKKESGHVFGPIMPIWDEIPVYTKIEIWHYAYSDGYVSLYFFNESNELKYKAFTPKGVAY